MGEIVENTGIVCRPVTGSRSGGHPPAYPECIRVGWVDCLKKRFVLKDPKKGLIE